MKTLKKSSSKAKPKALKTKAPAATRPAKTAPTKSAPAKKSKAEFWTLRLYVAGQTPRSLTAFSNLKKLCEEHLKGQYKIEVVDLVKQPHLAQSDQIVALPTLVRKLPEPIKRIVGDLSNKERVMVGMEIRAGI